MKFQFIGGLNETLTYIIGWLCFLSTLKFIKLLRFNKRMDMLGSTLRASGKNMAMFSKSTKLFGFSTTIQYNGEIAVIKVVLFRIYSTIFCSFSSDHVHYRVVCVPVHVLHDLLHSTHELLQPHHVSRVVASDHVG